MRCVIAIASLLFFLSGCTSLEPVPLFPQGHAFYSATILPSLSLPDPGLHPFVWGGYGKGGSFLKVRDSGTKGATWTGGGGVLYQQASLHDDFSAGVFASAEAGFELEQVTIDYQVDQSNGEAPLSAEEAALFPATRWAQTWTSDIRAGVQAKLFIVTFALYGTLDARVESGDYADFRRRIDSIGRFINLSVDPLTVGYGIGFSSDIGESGQWAVGWNVEVQEYWARSQTAVDAYIDETPGGTGTWVIRREAQGSVFPMQILRIGSHFDVGHIRLGLGTAIELSNLFQGNSPINQGALDLTAAYRW